MSVLSTLEQGTEPIEVLQGHSEVAAPTMITFTHIKAF